MMDDIGCTFLWCMYSNFFWQTNDDVTIETAPTEKTNAHNRTNANATHTHQNCEKKKSINIQIQSNI